MIICNIRGSRPVNHPLSELKICGGENKREEDQPYVTNRSETNGNAEGSSWNLIISSSEL